MPGHDGLRIVRSDGGRVGITPIQEELHRHLSSGTQVPLVPGGDHQDSPDLGPGEGSLGLAVRPRVIFNPENLIKLFLDTSYLPSLSAF